MKSRTISAILLFSLISSVSFSSEQKNEHLSPSAINYFLIGKIYEYQQQYEKAVENYKQALVFDPYSSFLRNSVGILLIRKSDLLNAIKQFQAAVDSDKEDYDSRILLATLLFSKGDIEGARRLLEEARSILPERIDAYLKLSDLYLFVKDERSALSILKEMLKNSTDRSEAYLRMGNIYLNRRNLKMAIESFTNSLKIDPSSRDAALLLSISYELEERYDKAIETLKTAQKYVADDTEIILSIGKLYLREEDFRSAKLYFDYAIRNSASIISMSITVAQIYSQEGYYKEAEEIYRSLLSEYNNSDELKYYYGKLLITMKRYDDGIEILNKITDKKYTAYSTSLICAAHLERKEYAKALECSNHTKMADKTLFFITAEALIGLKRYEETRKMLESSIKKREIWCDAIIYLARVYERIISADAAIALLNEAVNRHDILLDEKIRILYEVGMIYERNSKINEALESMKQILKINPDNPEALNFIGYTYIDNNINLEQAKDMILRAYMHSSRSGAIIDSVGWMYYKLGDYETAIKYLKKANRLLPQEPVISDHLADTYLKLNNKKEAVKIYRETLKIENLEYKLRESIRKKIEDLERNDPSLKEN